MINLAVIGYGYWGPNLVRNFHATTGCKIVFICDLKQCARDRAVQSYPSVEVTDDYHQVVKSSQIDAVVIATPVLSHFAIAKEALENGKHIFIEKPFTASVAEARILIELAEKKKLKIMVDHTFLF